MKSSQLLRTRTRTAPILLVALAAIVASAGPAAARTVSLTVSSARFSPNGDGLADSVRISVSLEQDAVVEVGIRRADGQVARRVADAQPLTAGQHTFVWDGRSGTGRRVSDGAYVVYASVIAEPAAEETRTVHVDTRAPSVAWRSITPEPIKTVGPLTFRFSTADADSAVRAGLVVYDEAGRRVRRVTPSVVPVGDSAIRWTPRYVSTGAPYRPGLYVVRLAVTDAAGNTKLSASKTFRIHRPAKARVTRRLESAGARVALTFDDCNSAKAWGRILDTLKAKRAKASFFCNGVNVKAEPALARRTVREGHTIGSHGWNHANYLRLSSTQIRSDVARASSYWWRSASSTDVPYFRPPYGAHDDRVVRSVGKAGYARVVMWDVDPQDWRGGSASRIRGHVVTKARRGSIVVLHTVSATVSALPGMIDGLRRRGLEPVSLDELYWEATH